VRKSGNRRTGVPLSYTGVSMRIGFTAPNTPGHLNPMTALARTLKARGHEVIFFGYLDVEPVIRQAGIDFFPVCQEQYPAGEFARQLHGLSQLSGAEALQYTIQLFVDACRGGFDDGPRAIAGMRVDGLVLDQLSRGFDMVAMHMGVPYVHVSNALHLDYSGHTPLALFDWPHERTPEAFARNRQGVESVLKLAAGLTEVQRRYAERVGLDLDWDDPDRSMSRRAWITQTPREFDFPGDHWPAHFHHTGPLHDGQDRTPSAFPWDRLTGEPLIYASMGTLQNGSEQVFRTIVEGVSAPGRQLVLSIGSHLEPHQIGAVPSNTIIVAHAPQIEILKRAALCVTHAGLNTVLESLAQGVPMVAVPVTNDQPGVAARIAHHRAGVAVPLKELAPDPLRAAVHDVLSDPSYRDNARRLQRAIAKADGLTRAADIVESALSWSGPSTSS
jgi:MGT family glycosyltransferase